MSPIKRVIKHRTNQQYYAGDGKWTLSIKEAKDFKDVWQLVIEAERYGLKDCCAILLKFNGDEFDIEMTL